MRCTWEDEESTRFSQLFTPLGTCELLPPLPPSHRRTSGARRLNERARATLLHRLSDVVFFCQSTSHIQLLESLVLGQGTEVISSAVSFQKNNSPTRPSSNQCVQLLYQAQSRCSYATALREKLRILTSVYILYSRCSSPTEVSIMEAIVEKCDLCPAYQHCESFCRLLLPPSSCSMDCHLAVTLVESLLKPFCSWVDAPILELPTGLCPRCGHVLEEPFTDSSICQECGFVNAMGDTDYTTQLDFKEAGSSGRHHIENYTPYSHLSVSLKGQKRMMNTIFTSVKRVCQQLGIVSDGYITNIVHTIIHYAQSGRTARRTEIIAACAFIVLWKNHEAVCVAELASALKIHNSTLLGIILRVWRTLGFQHLPSCDYLHRLSTSLSRLTEHDENHHPFSETSRVAQGLKSSTSTKDPCDASTNALPCKKKTISPTHILFLDTTPHPDDLFLTPRTKRTSGDSRPPSPSHESDDLLGAILEALDEKMTHDHGFQASPPAKKVAYTSLKRNDASSLLPSPLAWQISQNATLVNDIRSLFVIYQSSLSFLDKQPCSLSTPRTSEYFSRSNITSISGRGLYILAAATFYTLHHHHLNLSSNHIAGAFKLNIGTFNRSRFEFIQQLHRLLIHIGLLSPINVLTTYEKKRLVIRTTLSNLSILNALG